ncbi:MAG: DUF4346 domain-containing protein [Chloroflexi bacterium]|nr:DUF4346 domain-containing protein [Chloroflexota bacterium]
MTEESEIEKVRLELRAGMGLAKCHKCRCMKEMLDRLHSSLSSLQVAGSPDLVAEIGSWLAEMKPPEYSCLGCEHCFPAVVTNILSQALPEVAQADLRCAFEVKEQEWPVVPGEYFTFDHGQDSFVAVSTLASTELAERLAALRPKELCIVGKTKTENIGVDKVVKNIITNSATRFLVLAGREAEGHQSGKTLLSLWENGVDDSMRVVGSPGKHPILRNITREEIEAFRNQIQLVNLIGCEDEGLIVEKLRELSQAPNSPCSCKQCADQGGPAQVSTITVVRAGKPGKAEIDEAGYFVIVPQLAKGRIVAEHYSYDNSLLHVIESTNATSLYWTIIENGWVTQLSHAAYLGRELTKAELSIKLNFKYVQDDI